jgi:hypothetical protein
VLGTVSIVAPLASHHTYNFQLLFLYFLTTSRREREIHWATAAATGHAKTRWWSGEEGESRHDVNKNRLENKKIETIFFFSCSKIQNFKIIIIKEEYQVTSRNLSQKIFLSVSLRWEIRKPMKFSNFLSFRHSHQMSTPLFLFMSSITIVLNRN